jgi:hypothetical protein
VKGLSARRVSHDAENEGVTPPGGQEGLSASKVTHVSGGRSGLLGTRRCSRVQAEVKPAASLGQNRAAVVLASWKATVHRPGLAATTALANCRPSPRRRAGATTKKLFSTCTGWSSARTNAKPIG